ncbi:MAG: LysR family transcriptional regulator [Lachnospiraceae bacterium]|nr:LysR family transcriptional regulator [Lachnospiraceae bacterium]
MEQNLNLYQIFYEVAGCRNFSVAAKKLYISQPAVSKAISKLEENLNTTLFHRSSRGVTLTREGELLYQHVEQALRSLKSGEELLKESASLKISHLSIGVSTTLCKYVLLPLLKTFIAENPNIKITISCQSTLDTITALQNNSIDIGLVGIPAEDSFKGNNPITYLPLKTIEDIFVATDSYLTPLQYKYKGELHENEEFFHDASFIMLNRENISRKHTDTFLSTHQIELHNIIEVNHMDLSIEFAKAGLGIACVISDFVEKELKDGSLREVKLGHKIPRRQIGFAYPTKDSSTEAMKTFIQYYQTRI